MVATLALLLMTPAGSTAFWWTLAGLASLVAMHAVYWIVTHPVNSFWLEEQDLQGLSAGFFSFNPIKRPASAKGGGQDNWKSFRDR